MAIRYIDEIPSRNNSRYAMVDIDDLLLDEDNPRFASYSLFSRESGIKQIDIINYLVKYGEVCDLASQIIKNHGLFGEDIMSAYVRDGKVVVLEGNRRLSACKLLLDGSLMHEELRGGYPLDSADERTRANIQQIMLLIYDDSLEAQKYIAAKHTQTNIKKWTVSEQYNYYYTQFLKGKSPQQIAREVGVTSARNVENKIRSYVLFSMIFDIVRVRYPDLQIGFASIRPIVDAFMPKLLGKTSRYSLGVECDANTFQYIPLQSQREIFDKILFVVGEAFLVRPEARAKTEINDRPNSAKYRISSDEIKSPDKFDALIDKNVRIPGLKKLIADFLGEDFDDGIDATGKGKHSEDSRETEGQSAKASSNDKNKAQAPNKGATFQKSTHPMLLKKEKETRFFADFYFDHLDPVNTDNKGLIAVAKEIKNLSCYSDYTGYYKFPLAASFLLRSLIEQTLLRHLKETEAYKKLCKDTNKATPELESIIKLIRKQCQSENYKYIGFDKLTGRDFCACFDGDGTKNQLDKIVHSPAECHPNKEFLDSMANGGLKSLLQKIVNQLT